jgi:hypothetical protein
MRNLRLRRKKGSLDWHPDFDFVRPDQENLFMVGLGYHSGRFFTEREDHEHYSRAEKTHYFIRCHEEETIERFKQMEQHFVDKLNFRATARLLSVTRRDIIEAYNEHYPERMTGLENV